MVTDSETTALNRRHRLAGLPAEEGLIRLYRQRCVQLKEHFLRLEHQGDEESLHDFRVSLRRLRSLLRNYRDHIQIDDSIVEQLRQLQRETNPARDLEVTLAQLQRVDEQAMSLLPPLRQQLKQAYRQLHTRIRPQWRGLWPALNCPILLQSFPCKPLTFGQLSGKAGLRQTRRLAKMLQHPHDEWSELRLHRIRIRAKRLRYLLEPFASGKEEKSVISPLKRFQDELGDYRDLQHLLQYINSLPAKQVVGMSDDLHVFFHKAMKHQKTKVKRYRKPKHQRALLKPLQSHLKHLTR